MKIGADPSRTLKGQPSSQFFKNLENAIFKMLSFHMYFIYRTSEFLRKNFNFLKLHVPFTCCSPKKIFSSPPLHPDSKSWKILLCPSNSIITVINNSPNSLSVHPACFLQFDVQYKHAFTIFP